jgi:hypothetical protein
MLRKLRKNKSISFIKKLRKFIKYLKIKHLMYHCGGVCCGCKYFKKCNKIYEWGFTDEYCNAVLKYKV